MKFAKTTGAVFSALMLFTTSAYSFPTLEAVTHKAKGCGTYKAEDGTNGKYKVEVEVTFDEAKKEATFHEVISAGAETKSVDYRLAATSNGFFTVHAGETKVGSGYCFEAAGKSMKTCHFGVKLENGWAERTVHIDRANKKVYRLGSFSKDGKVMAWQDHLGCKGKRQHQQHEQHGHHGHHGQHHVESDAE